MCPADETTFDYVRQRTDEPFEAVQSDSGAGYIEEYRFDVSKIQPLVAAPHSPDNRRNAMDCRDVKIDRVYIGCAPPYRYHNFVLDESVSKHMLCGGGVRQCSLADA